MRDLVGRTHTPRVQTLFHVQHNATQQNKLQRHVSQLALSTPSSTMQCMVHTWQHACAQPQE